MHIQRSLGLVSSAGCVAACKAFDRAIQIAILNHHLSEGVRGTLLLEDNSFHNNLISAINPESYNG